MSTLRYPGKISKIYLFKLSLPIFFSNFAIPFVSLVDTFLMGHLGNEKFLAATSIAVSVITVIFWSFGFLRMGTVGLVGQSLGKGDYREIVHIIIRNLIIALIISILLIFLQSSILYGINYFFKVGSETFILIEKYISIRIFSAPAEMMMYVLIGFYLGLQKTKISSFLSICFSISNIILSVYFVKYLNLNIFGVALGTLVAAYLTTILFLTYTYFFVIKNLKIIPRFQINIFLKKKIFRLFYINFDIFIRTLLLTFAFLWFNYLSSKLGENILAINTILMQFILFAAFFLDAYAFSTEGIISYSIGRRVKKSFLLAVKNSFEISFITGIIISIIYIFFAKYFINLLTDLDLIRLLSYSFIFWIIIIPPIASFCYQFDGIFIGASETSSMRNSMIVSVTLYIIVSIYLLKAFDNHGIWFSLLILMILRSFTLNLFFKKILKKF